MAKKKKSKKASHNSQLRGLFFTLGGGTLFAVCVAVAFAYSHGTAGTYKIKNVLLSPNLLVGKTQLSDVEAHTRIQRLWVFDKVRSIHYDPYRAQMVWNEVAPEQYQQFYAMLENERSVRRPGELVEYFDDSGVVTLQLTLSPKGRFAASYKPREFQEVQIASVGDVVRVELHEQNSLKQKWAYFYCLGISREAKRLCRK